MTCPHCQDTSDLCTRCGPGTTFAWLAQARQLLAEAAERDDNLSGGPRGRAWRTAATAMRTAVEAVGRLA